MTIVFITIISMAGLLFLASRPDDIDAKIKAGGVTRITRDPNDVYFINVSWTTKQFVGVSLNRTLDLILKERAQI